MDAALSYRRRGLNPTPVIGGEKAARLAAWQHTELTEAEIPASFEPGDGVGLVLGPSSGGLVCVDYDSAEALWLLTRGRRAVETGLVASRPSRSNAHAFARSAAPSRSFRSPKTGRPHVEVKGAGTQVVVPPSLHPSGERWTWTREDEPATVEASALVASVGRFAAVAELLAIWPTGGATGMRHDASRHLAGGLFRASWSLAEVEEVVGLLCDHSDDDEQQDRLNAVQSTWDRYESGEPTTGWPRLVELLGEQPSVDAVLGWLGVTDEDLSDPRPRVLVRQGELDKVTQETWDALVEANEPPVLFRRSNLPVAVERIDDTDELVIRTLDDSRLKHRAVELVRFEQVKQDKARGSVRVPATPSLELVRNVRVEADPPLPVINRVTPVPVYGPSGVLETEPGYHPDARVVYEPSRGLVLPTVPVRPTKAQIDAARSLLLDELLGDFPFVGEADRAHALAFGLLPFVRDLVDGPTPLHMFEAPKAGTGKGLSVRVLSALFVGKAGATATPAPTVEEEWRKKLFSLLLEGRTYAFVDNVNDRLDSGALASAITSETYTDRPLGVSETTPVAVRCVWVATANNPVVSTELARRSIRIRINAKEEHPHLRSAFRHADLVAWTVAHRGELLGAVYALVNAWLAKGRPSHEGQRLGSFESWSDVLGGILATAGVPGFLGNLTDFYETVDDASAVWRTFVEAWWDQHGPEPTLAADLLDAALGAGLDLNGNNAAKQANSLGLQIKRNVDTIYVGLSIRAGGRVRNRGNAYRLVPLDDRPWTPSEPAASDPFGPFDLRGVRS